MHSLIEKLLEKRGLKALNELSDEPMPDGSPSEKNTFEHYQKVLSSRDEVTVDKLKEFCENNVSEIEAQFGNLDNDPRKNERLVLLHSVYRAMIKAIEAPNRERRQLEDYLKSLIHE